MKPKPVELQLSPVDNQRLANLCGVLDENLRQIETALNVHITRRGEVFHIEGESDRVRQASRLLEDFYQRARRPLRAIALTTDTSALTAIANDFAYDQIFSRQIEAIGRPGDVAIGISTSGRSATMASSVICGP